MTILVSTLIQSKAKLQVNCLCVLMFLSFPLTMAEVPGPCRHSITREHLLTVRHLMDNQLRSGCSITYTFIERRSLSKCCFVKAALPWILELLTTHFKYGRGSVNDGYVQSLRALILNIYSQKCVPQINEEVEDKPESYETLYRGSPSEALQKASEVLTVYWDLVTMSDAPIDWRCQHEYTENFSSTTQLSTESFTEHFTESYGRNSVKASHRKPVRDLYKFGFIIASVCGGLVLLLTLYFLITQKRYVVNVVQTPQTAELSLTVINIICVLGYVGLNASTDVKTSQRVILNRKLTTATDRGQTLTQEDCRMWRWSSKDPVPTAADRKRVKLYI